MIRIAARSGWPLEDRAKPILSSRVRERRAIGDRFVKIGRILGIGSRSVAAGGLGHHCLGRRAVPTLSFIEQPQIRKELRDIAERAGRRDETERNEKAISQAGTEVILRN